MKLWSKIKLLVIFTCSTISVCAINMRPITFDKNASTENIPSLENPEIIITSFKGNMPVMGGLKSQNIINNLKVTYNDTTEDVVGNIFSNENYTIKFDDINGNLKIQKLSNNNYNDTIRIIYRYEDIELGEFNLNITNGVGVEIVGNDEIDLGQLPINMESKMIGKILIKLINNESSEKVVKVDTTKNSELKHLKTGTLLPYQIKTNLLKIGELVPVDIELKVKPNDTHPIGDYTGDLNLVITIE